jgi:hypothetical protein
MESRRFVVVSWSLADSLPYRVPPMMPLPSSPRWCGEGQVAESVSMPKKQDEVCVMWIMHEK